MQVYYQGMNFIPLHAWDTELRKENIFFKLSPSLSSLHKWEQAKLWKYYQSLEDIYLHF